MAKLKFNVSDVETGGMKRLPAPAVYEMKIEACDLTKPSGKDERLEVKFRAVGKKWTGYASVFEYINVESAQAAWKLREFLEAVGLVKPGSKKAAGDLDTDKLVGKTIKIALKPDTYNGEPSPKVGKMMPIDDEDDDEDEDDEADETDDDEDEASDDEVDLDDMSLEEMVEYAEEHLELDTEEIFGRAKSDSLKLKKLRAAVEEAMAGDDEGDEDETLPYDEWDLADLKAECKSRGLKTVGKKDALVARLEADDEESEEGL